MGVGSMATAAVRTQKRELEPHWRDALRASVKRLALRTWGALLLGLASRPRSRWPPTARPTRRSRTAAGGPPANWLGSFGAYASDALLLLFGMGSVLFLPVIALAGLRMMRLEPAGRIGRALAGGGDRRGPDRHRAQPDQRIGGVRASRRLGRRARARRGLWGRCRRSA